LVKGTGVSATLEMNRQKAENHTLMHAPAVEFRSYGKYFALQSGNMAKNG
jgi:hypothetical protein